MFFSFVLLLALVAAQAPATAPAKDALALLNEVAQRYADAKSYHIESVKERTSNSELNRDWQKTLLKAVVMPGGRYRYEGRSGFGSALLVSDGTTQWDYHVYERLYTQRPSSTNGLQERRPGGQEEWVAEEAESLVKEVKDLAHRLKSATFLPDETILVSGDAVECYVLHYSEQDLKRKPDDFKQDEKLWIDKLRKVLVKTASQSETYMITGSRGHIPMHEETTVVYPVVEFDQREPSATFDFLPPAEAKLIDKFRNPFSNNPQSEPIDFAGKPAPELYLKSADGKMTTLSSFHGRPVFIEFWATWCGPCVELMPELAKLSAETQPKGLAWMSIDNDAYANDAADFVASKHITWPNYHDDDGALGKAFQREGIPLGVLVDADGKVAFYKAGYEVSDLRSAIAKLGPQFSSVASATSDSK